MMKTLFELPFDRSFENKKLCSYTLKPKDIEKLQHAIENDYYFEFIYDDLPLWGFIGDMEHKEIRGHNVTSYHLFTDYIFSITHNGDGHVVEVNWENNPEAVLDISDATNPIPVSFHYTARWDKTHLASRAHVSKPDHQHLEIRWCPRNPKPQNPNA